MAIYEKTQTIEPRFAYSQPKTPVNTTATPTPVSQTTKTVSTAGKQSATTDVQATKDFEATHEKPGSGDSWITKEDYGKLSPQEQSIYKSTGYTGLESYWTAQNAQATAQTAASQRDFEANYEKPGAGDSWLTKTDYAKLSTAEQSAYKSSGYEGLQSYWEAQKAQYVSSTADVRTRIAELEKEANDADEMRLNRTLDGVPLDEYSPIDPVVLQQEADSCRAKAALLQSYLDAGAPIPKDVAALTAKDISAFVNVKDGNYTVNVNLAAQLGINSDTLKTLGATDADIAQAQAQSALIRYKTVSGYDIARAVADGKVDLVRDAGFDESVIQDAQKYNAVMDKLSSYKSGEGYDIQTALSMKVVTRAELLAVGFREADIEAKPTTTKWEYTTDKLADYQVGKGVLKEPQYDIAGYLRDNPNDVDYLLKQGFTAEAITEAKDYNKQLFVVDNPSQRYVDAIVASGGNVKTLQEDMGKWLKFTEAHPEIKELQKEAGDHPSEKLKPTMSVDSFVNAYLQARGLSGDLKDKKSYNAVIAAQMEYERLYGKGTALASVGTEYLSFVFSPARALQPDVSFKDISGMEWAVGGVQVALLVMPGVGGIVAKTGEVGAKIALGLDIGTKTVASGIITADIALNWKNMNNAERAFAVAMDTVIIGSAFNSAFPEAKYRAKYKVNEAVRNTKYAIKNAVKASIDKSSEIFNKLTDSLKAKKDYRSGLLELNQGLKTSNVKLITSGARKLELAGRAIPDELGGGTITKQARLIAGNPKNYIKESGITNIPINDVSDRLAANKGFIENAEKQLKNTRNKETVKIIQEKIKEAKRQVQVAEAEKTKFDPFGGWQKFITPEEAEKYLPAKANTTSKALTIIKKDLAKSSKTIDVKGKKIPVKELATKSISQVARENGVSQTALVAAVKSLPVTTRVAITIAQPRTATTTKTATKVLPIAIPATKTATKVKTSTKPSTETRPDTRTQALPLPETAVQPATQTAVQTATLPAIQTKVKPATQTATETATQTQFETQQKTKIDQKLDTSKPNTPPSGKKLEDLTSEEKRASVTWKQGIGWWILPPPYTNDAAIFSIAKPEGITETTLKTARATLQTLKGVKVPDVIGFDRLGIVRAVIRKPPRRASGATSRNAITFSRTGQASNNNVRNTRVGNYYIAGGGVSRKPIGKKRRRSNNDGYGPISDI